MNKKCLLVLACLAPWSLLFAETSGDRQDVEENKAWLMQVYRDAVRDFGTPRMLELKRRCFTPPMLDKLGRLSILTGSDMLTRSQDTCSDTLSSLSCRHFQDDWYVVSFCLCPDSPMEVVPVKLSVHKGERKIAYVTPYWGSQEPDPSLFEVKKARIDSRSAQDFARTFILAYVYPYVTMSPTLKADLLQLRERYCTEGARSQFLALRKKVEREDNMPGFDPLVHNFDFDVHWLSSLTVQAVSNDTFCIGYTYKDLKDRWKIRVKKEGKQWKVSEILE